MALDRILEKNFGALVLLGAAVGAFLSALGVVRIAQAAVIPDAVLLATAPVLARPTVNLPDRSGSAERADDPTSSAIDSAIAKSIHRVSSDGVKNGDHRDRRVVKIDRKGSETQIDYDIH